LFFFAGRQAVANPFETWSRALPFWSSRELGTWAVGGTPIGSLADGLAHAVIVSIACGLIAALPVAAEKARIERQL